LKWDLTFFYVSPEDENIKKDLEYSLEKIENIKKKYYTELEKNNLKEEILKTFFEESEKVASLLGKVNMYAYLLYSENTQLKNSQKLLSFVEDKYNQAMTNLSFWKTQLLKQDLKKLEEFRKSETLKNYRHTLDLLVKEKQHTLSEDAEKILKTMRITSRDSFGNLYDKLTSSYMFEFNVDGRVKELTGDQMRSLRLHKDKEIRRSAMKSFFERVQKDNLVIEHAFNSIVKNYGTESKLRKFDKPIHMKNFENEADNLSVNALIDITTEKTSLVHKYYKWKSEYLNEKLTLADIYAPMEVEEKEYSWEEAQKIVLEAFYAFDKEMGDIAKEFFDENRIDAQITPGKTGGAYCYSGLPNKKPFVLLNFDGRMSDVMTLAHELGHGIHGCLASEQTYLNFRTPLTTSEIASVFAEMLVVDKLLKTLDEENKKVFIASKIEEFFATMFRQNMFARFELAAHDLISEKSYASWDELSDIYEKELKIMFGSSVEITPEFKNEWACISHVFEVPFYVYAYNYANLLVFALYEKFLENGKEFVPIYKQLLKDAAKDSPENLLRKAGIDITDKNFWRKGFDFIENYFMKQINI